MRTFYHFVVVVVVVVDDDSDDDDDDDDNNLVPTFCYFDCSKISGTVSTKKRNPERLQYLQQENIDA